MKSELELQLAKDFSFMIATNVFYGDFCFDLDEKSVYGFPCECHDGWYQIIHDLCEELEDYYMKNNADPFDIYVVQIKEKFGGLRFYTNGLIDGADDIISKYEDLSYNTCEVCGAPGEQCINGGWLRTLCEEHRISNGYEICKEYQKL